MFLNREPFAIQLFRDFLCGRTVDELSGGAIPRDRIEMRLRVAAQFLLGQVSSRDALSRGQAEFVTRNVVMLREALRSIDDVH